MLHMLATLATLVLLAATTALIVALLDERRDAIRAALGLSPAPLPRAVPIRTARVRWQTVAGRSVTREAARHAA